MPLLSVTNLKKSYQREDGSLDSILDISSFQVEEKEQLALIGSSGSGKTTLLNILAGLILPESGSVNLLGTEITQLSESRRDRFRAKHIGYVFQTFNLLQGLTVLENVLIAMKFGVGVDRDYATQLLTDMGLEHRLDYYPSQLSVGQQQRVALARALANHPRLLLADEPTGNLDPLHAASALELLRSLCHSKGTALILVSHDPSIHQQFETILHLDDLNQGKKNHV